jgi:hypothetical protein
LKKSLPILKMPFDWRVLIAVVLFFNLAGYFLIPEILGVSRQKLFHFAGVAAWRFRLWICAAWQLGAKPLPAESTRLSRRQRSLFPMEPGSLTS